MPDTTEAIGTRAERPVPVGVGVLGDVAVSAQQTALDRVPLPLRPSKQPTLAETGSGIIALIAWIVFFGAGAMISTKAYRDALAGGYPLSLKQEAGYFTVTVSCYTVTNLFFLTCLASYLGCMASRWHIENRDGSVDLPAGRVYAAAVLRGFLFYTLTISGLLVVANENTIVDTTLGQFVRLAGFASALNNSAE